MTVFFITVHNVEDMQGDFIHAVRGWNAHGRSWWSRRSLWSRWSCQVPPHIVSCSEAKRHRRLVWRSITVKQELLLQTRKDTKRHNALLTLQHCNECVDRQGSRTRSRRTRWSRRTLDTEADTRARTWSWTKSLMTSDKHHSRPQGATGSLTLDVCDDSSWDVLQRAREGSRDSWRPRWTWRTRAPD